MKTFREFLSEDAVSDTAGTISRDKRGQGGLKPSKMPQGKQFSVLDLLKRKKKDDDDGGDEQDQKTSQQKPDGPGKQRDRKPQRYRQANIPASPRPEKGGPLAKRPTPSSGSMVQKKTAASKQPPQHKQISARPASTAMAGSRQRPAIRPAKSNLSRDNMGVKKVNVQDLGPTTQKRLNPAKSNQKRLPPAGFRAQDLRARG